MAVYSIINKSKLEGVSRIDAEYYQPEYLKLERILCNFFNLKSIKELLGNGNSLTGGATPLGAEYPNKGIKFLRVQNIMPGYLDFSDIVFISKKIHENELKRSKLIDGDVILTITGVSYGKAAVYKNEDGDCNINQHSVRIHFSENIIPEYIATFLNSKYGHFQSDRKITGNTRPALAYDEIKSYQVPLATREQQLEIRTIYDESEKKDKESEFLYNQAENMLLEELRLKDFESKEDLSSIVNLSDLKVAKRMDAEYFQPKYERIIKKIKTFNSELLGNIVSIKKGFEPGSNKYEDEGKLFIRVSSISKYGIIDKDQKYLNNELYQKLKKDFEPKAGEILLTKDATPGIAYVLKEDIEGIISSGILRMQLKDNLQAEYLALYLNSIIGQSQVERDSGGSIIAHWKPEQIKKILIPVLPKQIQKKITDLVSKSHNARKKAKELINEAKKKVEEMIEEEAKRNVQV